MKIRKEYIILVAVVLALSLYLFLRKQDRTHYKLPEVTPIVRSDISKIEISRKGTAIILIKKDTIWRIAPQGYPADKGKVKGMLDAMEKLTLTALVSESKNFARYNLGGDQKLAVKAWAGDKLKRDFAVGKVAPSYRHTFVRVSEDYRVYHASGNFRDVFDQTVDNIRDKVVLKFDKAEITEIRVSKGEESKIFGRKQVPVEIELDKEAAVSSPPATRRETLWETAEGQEVDEAKLDRLLTILSNLGCEKYLDDRKKEDFTEPIYSVQARGIQEYSLSIFGRLDKDTKAYPAVSSGNDYPFLLQEQQANDIMKDPEELLAEPEKESSEKEEKG
jgi:hypothetical protein